MSALPGFLTRNWTLKLSAFGIALLLWVSVRVEAPNRHALEGVPVRVDLTDPQWALADAPEPATAVVRFTGPSRELIRMAVDRPSIVIPLDDVGSRDTTVVLRTQFVRIQDRPGVVVDDIQPTTVRLTFEAMRRLDLPVSIRMEGELGQELALAAPARASPAEVRVRGPESRLLTLDSIRLRPLNLDQVSESGRYVAVVDTVGMDQIQVQPVQVEVELVLDERIERVIGGVPVVLERLGWEEEFEIDPATTEVTVVGARQLVDAVDPGQFRVLVDLQNGELPEEPGDEGAYPVRLDGTPPLLSGRLSLEEVTIRRLVDGAGDRGADGGDEGAW